MFTFILNVIVKLATLYAFCVTAFVIADDVQEYDCNIVESIVDTGKYMIEQIFSFIKRD
jgi:hypothetical protein